MAKKIRRMKVFFNNGKYYTRVRWGTRKKDQGEVIFPLNTHVKKKVCIFTVKLRKCPFLYKTDSFWA